MPGYWNEINPKETKEIIQNDRDTLHSRAQSALDDESGGRFSKISPSKVTGAAPVTYPRLPSGPWSEGDLGAPDPLTDQLGYGINEVEAVLPASSAVTSVGQSPDAGTEPIASPTSVGSTNPDAAAALSADPGDAVAQGRDRHSAAISPQPSHKSFRRRF
jgi:hypothetical protein